MHFTDVNGNHLPTSVAVAPDGDGLTLYAVDSLGPVTCTWSLAYRGGVQAAASGLAGQPGGFALPPSIGSQGSGTSFGTLSGNTIYTRPVYVVGPQTSVQYVPPDQEFYGTTLDLVITAQPTNGEPARSVYIQVQRKTPNF
jgi:hypothetical protein